MSATAPPRPRRVHGLEPRDHVGGQRPHGLRGEGFVEMPKFGEADDDAGEVGVGEREADRRLGPRPVPGAERG
jgi:hypothetical protein